MLPLSIVHACLCADVRDPTPAGKTRAPVDTLALWGLRWGRSKLTFHALLKGLFYERPYPDAVPTDSNFHYCFLHPLPFVCLLLH